MPFTIPTEFFKGPEEVVEEKEENAEKPTEQEILKNESSENIEVQPNTNIEKTEQLEDQQFETKNPDPQIPVAEVRNISNFLQYFPECKRTLVQPSII